MNAMTPEEAVRHVITTDPIFAVHEVNVRGVTFKAFRNIPATIPALMAASRARQGDGAFEYLVFEDESQTYDQFCENVNRMAHALQDTLGMKQGDRIGIAMRNFPELLTMVLALSLIHI